MYGILPCFYGEDLNIVAIEKCKIYDTLNRFMFDFEKEEGNEIYFS